MAEVKTPVNPLFLRDDDLRQGIELLFFAYRDFTAKADETLLQYGFGRAHHRVIYFVGKSGMTVSELLDILKITKQSLSRVLGQLVRQGFIVQRHGTTDRRQRLLHLTDRGADLERKLTEEQRALVARAYRSAGAEAVEGFRKVLTGMINETDRERFKSQAPAVNPGMSDQPHILVVDDDRRLRDLIARYLGEKGYHVVTAVDAADARAKLKGLAFDLLVLDIMMPGENGLELTAGLRKESDVPILLLTARTEIEDRIAGFEHGADDYLTKPFEPKELVLRIQSILKRARPAPAAAPRRTVVKFGAFLFELDRRRLFRGEEPFYLTEAETDLLAKLAARPGEALSREELLSEPESGEPGAGRQVDVLVTRLRRKIEDDPRFPRYLVTVRGRGYMLQPD